MRARRAANRAGDDWQPFEPGSAGDWTPSHVAHLHRRAGFLPSWEVLQRDLREGLDASLARLLDGEATSLDGLTSAEFERDQDALTRQAAGSGQVRLVQAAWLHRMIHTPHPLRERMTLFWHNHFATSQAKVNNLGLMTGQIQLFREHALGPFGPLLTAVGRDPAMLIWLDATTNRKAHPNENYAREVMELFTLGRGHYTEIDIREVARAFTGRFVQGDVCRDVPAQHDSGSKTIFGKTGPFVGEDVGALLLEQPGCATFLARKLAGFLVDETRTWDDAAVAPVAERLRSSGYDIRDAVGFILRSRLFHSPAMREKRIKSPVELTVGAIRALEAIGPTVSTLELANTCERMGQSLYQPPNVAGWPGGEGWLSTTSLVARANFAAVLVSDDAKLGRRVDAEALARRHGASDSESRRAYYAELLLGDSGRSSLAAGETAAAEVAALLASAEFQLA